MTVVVERPIGREKIIIETGKLASQAHGAATVRCGDTVVLATVVMADKPRPDVNFLPLTVDYEERLYSVGKIPGSFFRREGRPGQEAILSARLIDRSIRPFFVKGLRNDVQVIITVLSVDMENPPEILGILGASAALSLSHTPFKGPISACRMALIDGQYIVNPTYQQISESPLNLIVSSTRDAMVMVEAGGDEVSEQDILQGADSAHQANQSAIQLIEELTRSVGKPDVQMVADIDPHTELKGELETLLGARLAAVLEQDSDKIAREAALDSLEAEVVQLLGERHPARQVGESFKVIWKEQVRKRILEQGVRPDGRALNEIRPITCEVGMLPRTHGSGLFTRGGTQVLSVATLASLGMKQTLDTVGPDGSKRYMHHYNFPPYSTGEVKRTGSPGRREIGHGALAERAILTCLPSEEEFPYALRVVSEVLSSNGSTSMASVCGSTLALMDAGVPIKSPVAGVAMGLITGENGRVAILTDIQGSEDALGDMDFKVAGTEKGINALQLDVKGDGLDLELMRQTLEQARVARLQILEKMKQTIDRPRGELSQYAPKMVRLKIPVEKIGALIGPGGRMIRAIIEETGATIDVQDDGSVMIGAPDQASIERARSKVEGLTRELIVGDIFTGKVSRLTSFGAFVELLPGRDGLVRSGDLGDLEEGLKLGQEVTVVIQEIDSQGRLNLSRRALFGNGEQGQGPQPAARPPFDRNRPRPGPGDGRRGGPPGARRGFQPGGPFRRPPGGGGPTDR